MKSIELEDIVANEVYCYYQRYDGIKYIAFIKLVGIDKIIDSEIGEPKKFYLEYSFQDVIYYMRLGDDKKVQNLEPDLTFEVDRALMSEDGNNISIYEMTEEELQRHVLMESL